MNKFIGIGNLVADVQVTKTNNGKAVAKFKLAVQRQFKNENGEHDADFLSCIAWDKKADLLEQYTKKGTKIAVIGNIRTGSYDGKDGKKVYTTEVYIDEVELLGSREEKVEETKLEPIDDDLGDNLPFWL